MLRWMIGLLFLGLTLPAMAAERSPLIFDDDPKLARDPFFERELPVLMKSPAKSARKMRYLGAAFEMGSPDILGVSVIGRPIRWLRLMLGLGTDTAAVGIHGGFTVVPLDFKVSPSFTLEGGRMFDGGSNFITEHLSVKSFTVQRLSYDYANIHLGVEVGAPNRCLFYLHAGVSYMTMEVHGYKPTPPTNGDGPLKISDPTAEVWTFSGKIGVVVYLL